MKITRLFTQILAVALCLALLCPLCAFAEEGEFIPAHPDNYAVIDPAAMEKLVEDYMTAHKMNKDNISVGYCYLDTGDAWYYNGDTWNFGAGVYYVPVMMLLAEWEHDGKLSRDSNLKGITLGDAERYVLVYSNNYYAHEMMHVIGSDKEVREKYRSFSPQPEEYYDPDFYDYGYFSARVLTDMMTTLYNENERFPNIIECLKESDNGSYFHGAMRGAYEVAQKYGNYIDKRNVEYNNTTGIIYTPHPFVLTVMTKNLGITQEIMWDMAVIFKDYTLSLDEAYEAYSAGPAAVEPEPAAPVDTPEAPAQEEGEENTQPQIPVIPAPTATEGEQNAAEEQPAAVEPQPAQTDTAPAPEQPKKESNPTSVRRMAALILLAALLVILILAAILRPILRKKRKEQTDED